MRAALLLLPLLGCGGDPTCAAEPAGAPAMGDTNGDGHVDIADVAWLARGLTQGGEAPVCAAAADVVDFGVADASGGPVDLSDVVGLLDHLYTGSTTLPELAADACDGTSGTAAEGCGALGLRVDAERKVRGAGPHTATVLLDSPDLRPEGWSVSVRAEGCTITAARLDGTVGARAGLDPKGQRRMGFGRAETSAQGAASAVLLSWQAELRLDRGEGIPVLALEWTAEAPDRGCEPCWIRLEDGAQGGGQPVENLVSVGGRRYAPSLEDGKIKVCAD